MRINQRIDAKFKKNITKTGHVKKGKSASLPPENLEMANLIFDRLHERNPLLSLTAQMSALTGLRYSDCSWLRYDDFYDEQGRFKEWFDICQQKTFAMRVGRKKEPMDESEAFRKSLVRVYSNSEIENIVEETRYFSSSCEFLFANRRSRLVQSDGTIIDRPMSIESADWHHNIVGKELNLKWTLGTHSWRKFFAKQLIKNGATIEEIRDALGQSSLTSTNAYLVSIDEELKKHVSKLTLKVTDQ